ncbi:hypothetical protein AN214_04357 [Pseudoalteromonas sp. P1-9]|uniref:hypothetical protein n=1 Tax=Pseudoalteromonas sp. P1-9 TaxID=1710354 RepID=UPI0006D5D3E2|nr:hypothetical protein [Pseudoalteromonas sp. P1-9]KPV93607.1 hypothetical protein AN214_04357 [Pseudoalteromonas sp. P1-9]
MTTLAQIKKIAKQDFIPAMKARGFLESSKSAMVFYKKHLDDIFQVIMFDLLSNKEDLEVLVFSWVPELKQSYDMKEFPKKLVITNGGSLDKNGLSESADYWEVSQIESVASILNEIIVSVDSHAIPWLNEINSREKLVDALFPDVSCRPNFTERKERILSKSLSNLDN